MTFLISIDSGYACRHRFFSFTSPNDVLQQTCFINYARVCVRGAAEDFPIVVLHYSAHHFDTSLPILSVALMRSHVLFLVFIQFYLSDSLQLGLIRNVSLIGASGFQLNQTTCSECTCLLATTSAWVAFNCDLSNSICQMIASYNTTTALTIQSHLNSSFYFRQLPPISTTVTGNPDAGNSAPTTRLISVNERA